MKGKVLVYKPDQANGEIHEIELSNYDNVKNLVDCEWITIVYLDSDTIMVLDDEGLLRNKPLNRGYYGNMVVVGNTPDGDYAGLTDEQIKRVREKYDGFGNTGKKKIDEILIGLELPTIIYSFSSQEYIFASLSLMDVIRLIVQKGSSSDVHELKEVLEEYRAGKINSDYLIELFRVYLQDVYKTKVKVSYV